MNIQLTRIIEWLLLPPGLTIILLLLAINIWNRRPQRENRNKNPKLLWFALLSIYGMSINVTADFLTSALERPDLFPALSITKIKDSNAEAIVILGHGRYPEAKEYDDTDTLNTGGLARVRYGAKLHRETGLPILTAGGTPYREQVSEAAIMKMVLEQEFNIPVKWLEEKSSNTYENALFSSMLLEHQGIKRVLLVTHARDMIRALWAFQKVGILQITPAPTLFSKSFEQTEPLDWIPNPYALSKTAVALHEHIGIFWYRWRYSLELPQPDPGFLIMNHQQ